MNEIISKDIFNGESIAASGSKTSNAFNLSSIKPNGFFSLQLELTGDGTGKIEFECSNDGKNFLTPSESEDIVTSHTKTSGPGEDGKDIYSFTPPPCMYLRIKATETGGGNGIVLNATLVMQ